jgi:hypothetical protein
MSRFFTCMLAGGAIALGGLVGSATAMPKVPLAGAEPTALIQKVHGGHRACVWRRWWHRHVGPYDRPVSCDRVYGSGYYGGPSLYLRFGDRDRRYRRGDGDDRRGDRDGDRRRRD